SDPGAGIERAPLPLEAPRRVSAQHRASLLVRDVRRRPFAAMRGDAMKAPPPPRSVRDRFKHWLDQPQPIERLAFVRIVLPLIILGFLSSRLVHADHWLSPVGFRVPDLGGHDWRQPLYLPPVSPLAAWVIAVVTTIAGLLLAAGLFTRPAA